MRLDIQEDVFNRRNVEVLYTRMSAELGIPRPKLTWNERTRNGRYRNLRGGESRPGEILVGPKCWRRWHAVIHEFAHHVHFHVGGEPGHGPLFREALRMVAYMALGDEALYAWANEYRSISRWWASGGRRVRSG